MTARGPARSLVAMLLTLAPAFTAGAASPDPYSAMVGVTGRDNLPERARGIGEAYAEVLIKVTGDRTIVARPRFGELAATAADDVRELHYRDRKEGTQISDEQGTRDRSFELTVTFEPAAIDEAVRALGATSWVGERPTVRVLLAVTDSVRSYVLASDAEPGYGQRETFWMQARRRGVDFVIPDTAELSEAGMDAQTVRTLVSTEQSPTTAAAGPYLTGLMMMNAEGYWQTQWRLAEGETVSDWRDDPTTFDRAIADAVDHTIRRLAGLD